MMIDKTMGSSALDGIGCLWPRLHNSLVGEIEEMSTDALRGLNGCDVAF
jgi:hypothetical protein